MLLKKRSVLTTSKFITALGLPSLGPEGLPEDLGCGLSVPRKWSIQSFPGILEGLSASSPMSMTCHEHSAISSCHNCKVPG